MSNDPADKSAQQSEGTAVVSSGRAHALEDGPVDRPSGAIEDGIVSSTADPAEGREFGGGKIVPPGDAEPVLPPYDGRKESTAVTLHMPQPTVRKHAGRIRRNFVPSPRCQVAEPIEAELCPGHCPSPAVVIGAPRRCGPSKNGPAAIPQTPIFHPRRAHPPLRPFGGRNSQD
jgi:hypothetical protein